ncbi:MAG: conjugal transfer protein TrbI [Sphingobium sp. 66-54]|nr:MAG: conjugal transfer protein TrbI [Sphingobium sp. 66-54]
MSEDVPEEPVPTKVDPEAFALRGNPGRVVRFRRSAIIGLAGLGSVMIVGAAWMALKPASFRMIASHEEPADVETRATADILANAPKSYGDVPQLGVPLPGDLGRPILAHQRAVGAAAPPATPDQVAQAAEAERQRLVTERKAARESGIMMQIEGGSTSGVGAPQVIATPGIISIPNEANRMAFDPDRDPGAQQHKADFVAGGDQGADLNSHGLVAPASPWTLSAGSIIAASLITGLNSDLPGLVTAQVTENVWDSITGRTLLIPQGSRLIGRYDSVVAFGQKRALVVWSRIILPDGSSVRIDNASATDTAGYAGLADKVDGHSWQLLKGVALSTLLGVGTELSFGSSESDLVRAIRQSAQQSGTRAGDQLVLKSLNVQPTIRVRPGWPLRIVVHKDLVLQPWQETRR